MDNDLKEFTCWKCKILLFLYKIKLSIVITCPECNNENRAGAGSDSLKIRGRKKIGMAHVGKPKQTSSTVDAYNRRRGHN